MQFAYVRKVRDLAHEVADLCMVVEEIEAANRGKREANPGAQTWHLNLQDPGRANAALKRRSLDLTRALADMRRP